MCSLSGRCIFVTESNKQYTLKTCYYIPNDKMPEEFGFYLKEAFMKIFCMEI